MTRSQVQKEEKFYGLAACHAVFAKRPGDIRKVFLRRELRRQEVKLLDYCASNKIGFDLVEDSDLQKLTQSLHHEGMLLITSPRKRHEAVKLIASLPAQGVLMLLHGVSNPHNIGAAIRSAAHFGVFGVIGDAPELQGLSGAAARVAEGGAEHVKTAATADWKAILSGLKAKQIPIIATSRRGKVLLGSCNLPKRAAVVFGAESEGIPKEILKLASVTLAIPGTGAIDSLNVASSASIVLWEFYSGK